MAKVRRVADRSEGVRMVKVLVRRCGVGWDEAPMPSVPITLIQRRRPTVTENPKKIYAGSAAA
jgi:hypothetical protein